MEQVEINYKKCAKCGEIKAIGLFGKYKSSKDGLRSYCKCCSKKYYSGDKQRNKEYHKEYYLKNKEYINKMSAKWKKENPQKVKKHSKDHFKKMYSDKLYKEKHLELNSLWAKSNRGKRNISQLKYLKTQNGKECDRRRIVKRRSVIGNYSKEQWEECLSFFNYEDAYTGVELSILSIDHIIPISKGGTGYIWNLIPCEKEINSSKNNSELLKWYSQQPYFSKTRLNKIYKWIEYSKEKYLNNNIKGLK